MWINQTRRRALKEADDNMAAMVWSALALAGFVLMAVLIIALVRRKRGGGRTGRGKALLWALLPQRKVMLIEKPELWNRD